MKRVIIIFSLLLPFFQLQAADFKWLGNLDKVISVLPPSSSGLNEVCVLQSLQGVSLSVETAVPAAVRWYRYSNLGGGFAEELTDVSVVDGMSRLNIVEPDMGYIIEDGNERHAIWVVDYGQHEFTASALGPSSEKDCMNMALNFSGNADEIVYYSINGRRLVLDREIRLAYRTLEPDQSSLAFNEKETSVSFVFLSGTIMVPAPLCATDFTLEGDRFLREWGRAIEVTSPVVEPYAVSSLTSAVQTERDADNEVNSGSGESLGGSAPCIIDFEAAVTDGAIFREWQFSRMADFDVIDMRISDLSFTHTFNEEGTTYVRFVCANSDGGCEHVGETYAVNIGTSSLKCPNAFSPGNADGVNDEWKVSYASIIDFECHIFDRYGRKMISLTHPSQGWDGKYKGKLVPSGAYFYVIKAKGADGRKYELSGDINIVNYE